MFRRCVLASGNPMLSVGIRYLRSRTCQIRAVAPTRGLEEFFDIIKRPGQKHTPAGSAWTAAQLRRKSMSDLHKLYYVLWKERNMLLTEKEYAMAKKIKMDNPARLTKVKQSIARLRHVWDERMKLKTSIRTEEKAVQEQARVAKNKLRKKKAQEESYIQKKMAQFASATPGQHDIA